MSPVLGVKWNLHQSVGLFLKLNHDYEEGGYGSLCILVPHIQILSYSSQHCVRLPDMKCKRYSIMLELVFHCMVYFEMRGISKSDDREHESSIFVSYQNRHCYFVSL